MTRESFNGLYANMMINASLIQTLRIVSHEIGVCSLSHMCSHDCRISTMTAVKVQSEIVILFVKFGELLLIVL